MTRCARRAATTRKHLSPPEFRRFTVTTRARSTASSRWQAWASVRGRESRLGPTLACCCPAHRNEGLPPLGSTEDARSWLHTDGGHDGYLGHDRSIRRHLAGPPCRG